MVCAESVRILKFCKNKKSEKVQKTTENVSFRWFSMVDDTGLVPMSPTHCKGCSPLDCFYALFPIKKEKPRSLSTSRLMVDDTGLEPVTLRTSSGCSYQLS